MRGRSSLPAPTNITTGSISPGNSNSNMELEHPKSERKRLYFGVDAAELAPKMVKGARVYTGGTLRADAWEQDGKQRSGLSIMSWHYRIAAIGRNRPKRERKPAMSRAPQHRPAPTISTMMKFHFKGTK
jgi:hypothetical protein